jgi:molybdate transport system ATP-binding protein
MIALELDVTVRQDAFTLRVEDRASVQVLGLWGVSGAGKTTLLEALAGLRRASGVLRVGERTLLDSAAGVDVPARHRRVGYVPQDALLFPHLDVRRNIIYGAQPGADFAHIVEMLEIAPLVARGVAGLSGGERQRVALGRALMARPTLLLLDEPLAAVDRARRDRIVPYLQRIRADLGVPMIYVTHDAEELRQLADRVLAIDAGRVVRAGTPGDVLQGGQRQGDA